MFLVQITASSQMNHMGRLEFTKRVRQSLSIEDIDMAKEVLVLRILWGIDVEIAYGVPSLQKPLHKIGTDKA